MNPHVVICYHCHSSEICHWPAEWIPFGPKTWLWMGLKMSGVIIPSLVLCHCTQWQFTGGTFCNTVHSLQYCHHSYWWVTILCYGGLFIFEYLSACIMTSDFGAVLWLPHIWVNDSTRELRRCSTSHKPIGHAWPCWRVQSSCTLGCV